MKRPGKLCSFQFGLLSGNIFHSFYFRLTPPKLPYLNIDVIIKKSLFFHPFSYGERQERGNHEPLVSLRRPGSAEQAMFQRFSVTKKQAQGDREVRVTLEKGSAKQNKTKKNTKKHLCPYAQQDRETTKDILRIVNS